MATEIEALQGIIDEKRRTDPPKPDVPEFRKRVESFLERLQAEKLSPVEASYVDENTRGHKCRELAEKLGARYAGCTLENFKIDFTVSGKTDAEIAADSRMNAARCELETFARSMPDTLKEGGGVTLYGPPGCGKDHLMAALMFRAIIDSGYSVEWVNGLDLYADMRSAIRKDEDESAFIRKYQKPLILAISDPLPPKGETSEYQASVLYRIIDRRYRDMKSTWATMNVDGGDEARERIAGNVVDRLRHNSLCIHCDWESFRRPA